MTDGTTAPVPLGNIEQIQGRIADLQERLQKQLPGYEGLLHTIHVELIKDAELVHLLKPEEVGVIVSGLAKRKQVVLVEATSKSKTAGGKSLKNLSVDDI